MSMGESLEIIQSLYEKGYLTYPRTNSEYLATAEKDKMRKILSQIERIGYPVKFKDSPKIFTLLLALKKLSLDQMVTIPTSAADIPADSSIVPVFPGEQMRVEDLLHGLMIRSGNDAANAVAELCSGSVDAFAAEMNTLAAEIGMTNSHFVNPHGYHDIDHFTTARDLAVATRLGLTDPVFCKIVTCMNYTIPSSAQRSERVLQNIWEIFDPASEFFIPNAAGVKSGYTSAAGFCYAGAAQRGEKTLIAVILGETTRNRAWMDLSRLFEYGFSIAY